MGVESAPDRGYRDLIVWQRARVLVSEIYRESASWPLSEQFGLTAQVRRCAVSIASNIAEGKGRSGARSYAYHLSFAHGHFGSWKRNFILLSISSMWMRAS